MRCHYIVLFCGSAAVVLEEYGRMKAKTGGDTDGFHHPTERRGAPTASVGGPLRQSDGADSPPWPTAAENGGGVERAGVVQSVRREHRDGLQHAHALSAGWRRGSAA